MLMSLGRNKCADLLELLHERLAAGIAIHALIMPRARGHLPFRIDDDDLRQIVPQSHLKVVRVVRRRHLDRARPKCGIDIGVGKERDAPSHDGQNQRFPDEMFVPFVVRVYRDARIAEHRLGARGCDLDVLVRPLDRIAQMPEMPLFRLVVHLDVGDRRRAGRAPVRDARALIDEPLLVETDERLAHRTRTSPVHREPLARPVTGRTEHPQLIHDAVAVLLLPRPHALEELLAPEVEPRRPLRAQRLLDLCLRRDARMVAARHPDDVLPAHPLIPHEDILQSIVECMPHVELSRHIRRRDDDAVRFAALVRLLMKKSVIFPIRIPFPLKGSGIVVLRNIGALLF